MDDRLGSDTIAHTHALALTHSHTLTHTHKRVQEHTLICFSFGPYLASVSSTLAFSRMIYKYMRGTVLMLHLPILSH